MHLNERIAAFEQLGKYILSDDEALKNAIQRAYLNNNWFTVESCKMQLQTIATAYLDGVKLHNWVKNYTLLCEDKLPIKIVGIVCAGNLPLVGFHDILSVLICGYTAQIKLSEKDKELPLFLLQKLIDIQPLFTPCIKIVSKLENFDAIIATGTNQTAAHFRTYFNKYQHIIRNHRNGIAILTGTETEEDLFNLGKDVFSYFGLGCRNVSLLFVPKNYNFTSLINAWQVFKEILMNHNSYRNNLDYQRTIYLMKQTPMIDIDFVNMTENDSLYSPVSCLHYTYYDDINEAYTYINKHEAQIQCIIGKDYLAFGKSQLPELDDYADNTNTLAFLTQLDG